ncbi:hypothetical protein AVEN_37071-1 [Araneus ventricosus]|uniref:Uncharacterized protein n=1 Tax=Araneus ventricosus TaxID=182803 RepID=A0A4Y2Q5W2_ARAVE|nr:hypothetical protein AVEN_37071-1 [Araneus ventricosus]
MCFQASIEIPQDICYDLRLFWHKGGVEKSEDGVPEENPERSSASSNSYSSSNSFISIYSSPTFSTSSYSTLRSTASEQSGEDYMDMLSTRKLKTVPYNIY